MIEISRIVAVFLFTVILLSILSTSYIQRVMPSDTTATIYIRGDGSIDPPTAPIQRDGDTYTLTGNVYCSGTDYGILIQRDNMILDGAGFTLQGGGGWGGIPLMGRSGITIKRLNIKSFVIGISFAQSSDIQVLENNISENGEGIYFDLALQCHNNLFEDNNFVDNSGIAIYFHETTHFDETGTRVFHNNFINNGIQAYEIVGCDAWDDGYPSGGNFWSDYTGVDLKSGPNQDQPGSDGIGDTPYIIGYWNGYVWQDRYPLIKTIKDNIAVKNIEPIQVVQNEKALILNKDTAISVDITSTFSQQKKVKIDVTYDFGHGSYTEVGPDGSGVPINQGLNRVYLPGGPVFHYDGSNWVEDVPAWSPIDPYTNQKNWNYFFRWTSQTGTDDNIAVKVEPLPDEISHNDDEKTVTPGMKVADTNPLKILFIPVRFENDPPDVFDKNVLEPRASQWIEFLNAVYPTSEVSYNFYWPTSDTPAPPATYDPFTSWEYWLYWNVECPWARLAQLWGYDRAVILIHDLDRFYPDVPGKTWADAFGMNMLLEDRVFFVSDSDFSAEWTAAHELGHTYYLWHPWAQGPDIYDSTRFWVAKREYGTVLPTIMTYGSEVPGELNVNQDLWIDNSRYDSYPKGSVKVGPFDKSIWNLFDQFKSSEDPEIILMNAVLCRNGTGAFENDWYLSQGIPDVDTESNGNFSIVLLNASQDILGEFRFNASFTYFVGEDENSTIYQTEMLPLSIKVPFIAGTRIIQLMDFTESVLATRTVSDNTPSIQITSPAGGDILNNGNCTIFWTASDADGDSLLYNVAYSKDDGNTWIPIGVNLNETSYIWDTSQIESGTEYQVKVIASDGINTGQDVSSIFTVDNAPRVNMISPAGGEVYGVGNHTISWSYSNFNEENLLFNVSYSEDGANNWVPMAVDLNQTSYVWETSLLDSTSDYLIKVVATDGVNTAEGVSGIFTVDLISPTIDVFSPVNKTYSSNTIPLAFEADDPISGIDWTWYSLDNQPNVTDYGSTIDASEGAHQIIVYANDTAGNVGSSGAIYFTVDTTPPTTSILSPENKTYYATDVPLTFTVNETLSWVGYSLDGQDNVTIAGNTTMNELLAGSHELTVFANDTIGNMGSSEVVHFTVDTTVHDVAVVNVTVSRTVIGQAYNCTVNATLSNEGDSIEILHVTLFANTTPIVMQNTSLASHTSAAVCFAWNTSCLAYGNYTISVCALPVPGETNTADNNCTGGWVIVSIKGDLTGGTPNALDFVPDGKVDIVDVAVVAKCFGQKVPPAPANCDVSGATVGVPDGKIDITDVATVAKHFGEHYP